MAFQAPRARARFQQEIKRSRFIGIVAPVSSLEDAEREIQSARLEFPEATHHCWAYVLGNPESGAAMRVDDAGEPAGTAGKPILNVLRRRKIGNAIVIVVRFFGGIKLGAGGLVRAYSGTASRVLDETDLVPVAPRSLVRLHLDFGDEPAARRLLARLGIEVQSTDYASGDVLLTALVSEGERAVLVEQLAAVTGGRARIESAMDRL
ncbi:MAG TPA: YigZ family protein [Vicinamibacteria bacterium]|jgi:uncharacterized YigZ family protein